MGVSLGAGGGDGGGGGGGKKAGSFGSASRRRGVRDAAASNVGGFVGLEKGSSNFRSRANSVHGH